MLLFFYRDGKLESLIKVHMSPLQKKNQFFGSFQTLTLSASSELHTSTTHLQPPGDDTATAVPLITKMKDFEEENDPVVRQGRSDLEGIHSL